MRSEGFSVEADGSTYPFQPDQFHVGDAVTVAVEDHSISH